jgi:hypothetical protein
MINKGIVMTNHAKSRMKERDISEKELEEVIKSPDISYPGRRGEINIVKEVEGGKKVRVTYVKDRNKKIIITAMVIN